MLNSQLAQNLLENPSEGDAIYFEWSWRKITDNWSCAFIFTPSGWVLKDFDTNETRDYSKSSNSIMSAIWFFTGSDDNRIKVVKNITYQSFYEAYVRVLGDGLFFKLSSILDFLSGFSVLSEVADAIEFLENVSQNRSDDNRFNIQESVLETLIPSLRKIVEIEKGEMSRIHMGILWKRCFNEGLLPKVLIYKQEFNEYFVTNYGFPHIRSTIMSTLHFPVSVAHPPKSFELFERFLANCLRTKTILTQENVGEWADWFKLCQCSMDDIPHGWRNEYPDWSPADNYDF
jgi:hypothetical protein